MTNLFHPVAKLVSGVIHLEAKDENGNTILVPFKDSQESVLSKLYNLLGFNYFVPPEVINQLNNSGIPLVSLIDRIEVRDFDTCSSPECDCPNGYCFSDKGDEGDRFKKFAIIKPAEPKTDEDQWFLACEIEKMLECGGDWKDVLEQFEIRRKK